MVALEIVLQCELIHTFHRLRMLRDISQNGNYESGNWSNLAQPPSCGIRVLRPGFGGSAACHLNPENTCMYEESGFAPVRFVSSVTSASM